MTLPGKKILNTVTDVKSHILSTQKQAAAHAASKFASNGPECPILERVVTGTAPKRRAMHGNTESKTGTRAKGKCMAF